MRAILSALAGSGLTAAGLGGPLANAAWGETTTTPAGTASSEPSGSAQSGDTDQSQTETTTTTTTTPPPATTTTETTSTPTTTAPASTPGASAPSSTTPSTPTTTTGTSAPAAGEPAVEEAPTVVLKRKQQSSPSKASKPHETSTVAKGTGGKRARHKTAALPNHVAASPQTVAAEAGALAALLASSEASTQALDFYRIPLFLLPIYKAAAVQYGVPWQILAAINEIETDFGSDLSVSTAGAVGWMQFMPSTWLQYGVDALNAGYADPYNPVDAIFAAARYLRAAGAATNLRAAIFSYNHSNEYVESVLLRAKLISTFPKDLIATLTGLVDGRLPVTGKHLSWSPVAALPSAASATANATPASSASASAKTAAAPGAGALAPGATTAPSPAAAAATATAKGANAASGERRPMQLVELLSAPNASVVAVQDGRIMRIGHSRKLGRFLVLRDVYGDVFTYAGLGSIAPTYTLPKAHQARRANATVVEAASTRGPAPVQPASAGTQPVTLHVQTPLTPNPTGAGQVSLQSASQEAVPAGMDRTRLYAHPGNQDARAADAANAARRARIDKAGHALPLRVGSVVASGTVLGRVSMPPGARDGHMRFAIRPAGDPETVNPAPVLANWAQLQKALHPQGAQASDPLLGATASDVFLLSHAQLERTVLSDPGITMDACARHEVAAGRVDKRVLAVLEFLSRSGLEPTVSALRCTERGFTTTTLSGDEVDISAINGTPIAGHQGPETITELTVRTLLTLPSGFVPHEIVSLMRFPGAPNTHANPVAWNHIHLAFSAPLASATLDRAAAATAAHSAGAGRTAPAPVLATSALSATQWNQLMQRVAALPLPVIATKPSSAAIPDPKR